MIFESHAHYDDEQFNEDRDQLLESFPAAGIGYVVNVAADLETTEHSLLLAEKYPWIYAAVGVHPSNANVLDEESFQWIKEQTLNPKCVAVGEIGLDYYWDKEAKVQENQRYWFRQQMDLAVSVKKPVIIHSRDAAEDTMKVMEEYQDKITGGVIHCFSNSVEFARRYVDMGYYIGIGGVVTFKNAKVLKQVAADIPLEHIVLETDCPYMSPEPYRGRRNSSLNLPYVAKAIGQLKGISPEQVIEVTCENAKRLYGIK